MPLWNPIVTILPGGAELRFGRRNLTISEARSGRTYQYQNALQDLAIPSRAPGQARARISIPTEFLSVPALRDAGVLLGGADAEIAMWREGDDYKNREIFLTGRVEPNGVFRDDGLVTLELSDYAPQLNRRFPPYTITSEGFPNANANQLGKTMNIVYGSPVNDVPVQLIDPYNDSDDPSTYRDEIRFVIAGHRLTTNEIRVRTRFDSFTRPISYGFDHASGAVYAYFTLTQLQMKGTSTLTCDVFGHVRNGFTITGLGDVVEHAILTYSGLPEARIDYDRLSRFIGRANQLEVASVFGGDGNGTLMGLLSQRYGEPLGARFDWRNGKFGADLLAMDQIEDVGQPLRIGYELLDMEGDISYETIGGSEPYSSFSVEYDPDMNTLDAVGNPSMKLRETMDWNNDTRCSESYSRFGNVPFPTVSIPDINLVASARVILNWMADRYAVQRTRVSYLAKLDDVIRLPILRPYPVTDPSPQSQFVDERMRLESMQPREDDLAVVTLVSYRPSV